MEEKKTKKSFKRKMIAAFGLTAAAMLAFGISWAYYNRSQALANPLSTAHSGAAVIEEFDPTSSFLPGETVVKKVAFKNTGDMDLFLRVEVPPLEAWYYTKSENGETAGTEADQTVLDPSKVIKNWNPTWGTDFNNETDLWSRAYRGENGKWYRYYKKVLVPGETTPEILDSITLSTDISNDRHEIDYSDKVYKLTFCAEAVPVEDHYSDGEAVLGVQASWGRTVQKVQEEEVTVGDKTVTRWTVSWPEKDGEDRYPRVGSPQSPEAAGN